MKPITPASPHAIIMIGIPGSGKSTFAEHFADTFKTPIINESQIAFEASLNAAQTQAVSTVFLDELLKTNRTFLIEVANLNKAKKVNLLGAIKNAGYRSLIVWVQTEPYEAKRRALKPKPAGSGITSNEFDAAVNAFTPPLAQDKAIVISGKHTYATQIKVVLKQLAGSRPDAHIEPPKPRPTTNPRPSGNIVIR